MLRGLALLMLCFGPTLAAVLRRTRGNASTLQSPGPCNLDEFRAKDIDVVLFGATGFLGTVTAHYLAARPNIVKWAMAGREMGALRMLKENLMSNPSQQTGARHAKLLVADYDTKATLLAMTKQAKVIFNTAGPFEKYHAGNLIHAAIQGCAHYVDVSGETFWKADMMQKFGPQAAIRGLVVSQGAGFVSLMADWLALSAARTVAGDGKGPPSDVFTVFNKMNGAAGGGNMLSSLFSWNKYGPITNPYILSPETPEQARIDKDVDGIESYGHHAGMGMDLQLYAFARRDCPAVRRSMQLEWPNVPIKVHEAQNASLFEHLKVFLMDPRLYNQPPPTELEPHFGPPVWMQNEGSFSVHSWATRKSDGHSARVTIEGLGDPAFHGTARMTSELVIALATLGPYRGKVGYLSPAQVIDTRELEHRWTAVENWVTVTYKIEDVDPSKRHYRR